MDVVEGAARCASRVATMSGGDGDGDEETGEEGGERLIRPLAPPTPSTMGRDQARLFARSCSCHSSSGVTLKIEALSG